jgi:hypothetical protein
VRGFFPTWTESRTSIYYIIIMYACVIIGVRGVEFAFNKTTFCELSPEVVVT